MYNLYNLKRIFWKSLPAFIYLALIPFCTSLPIDDNLSLNDAKDVAAVSLAKSASSTNQDLGFVHAFVKAIVVIIVSELGDKTFFIAAIFAMNHSRSIVFTGAIAALGLMTFLSVVIGFATTIIPRNITFYVSVGLFVIFGLKMMHEGWTMNPNDSQEELNEVEGELLKKDEELEKANLVKDVESGVAVVTFKQRIFNLCSPILLQAFTLTFLAEWGDRSQITTVVLAASEDAFGVFVGAVIGHMLCTGFAVIGGRIIAQKISVRTVTIIGGVFFIGNAIFSLATGPDF